MLTMMMMRRRRRRRRERRRRVLDSFIWIRKFPYLKLRIQAPVVQTLDSAIHWINHYPADSVIDFRNTYPLDSDLSTG